MPNGYDVETGWPRDLADQDEAFGYLYCLFHAQKWMHRRVDTLSFVGNSSVRQRTSIDLSVPPSAPEYTVGTEKVVVLPLMPVLKGPLVNFDIRDGGGQPLSILTRAQNNAIVVRGMLRLVDQILTGAGHLTSLSVDYGSTGLYSINEDRQNAVPFPLASATPSSGQGHDVDVATAASLQQDLVLLVAGSAADSAGALARLESGADDLRKVLWSSISFRVLARRFAVHYYLTVCLPGPRKSSRRLIKLEYNRRRGRGDMRNHPFLRDGPRLLDRRVRDLFSLGVLRYACSFVKDALRRPAEGLGWVPLSVVSDANAALDCESYHIEIEAPPGLKICGLEWFISPPARSDGTPARERGEIWVDAERNRIHERIVSDLGSSPVTVSANLLDGDETSRVHTSISRVPLGYRVLCRWRMAPSATGWLFVSIPCVVAAVLTLFLLRQEPLQGTTVEATSACGQGSVLVEPAPSVTQCLSAIDISTLSQNRVTFLLGLLALTGTVLVRSGENRVTKRLLLFPRIALMTLIFGLLLAVVPLIVDVRALIDHYGWVEVLLRYAQWGAVGVLVTVVISQLAAWGLGRRLARRMPWLPRRSYWRVWADE